MLQIKPLHANLLLQAHQKKMVAFTLANQHFHLWFFAQFFIKVFYIAQNWLLLFQKRTKNSICDETVLINYFINFFVFCKVSQSITWLYIINIIESFLFLDTKTCDQDCKSFILSFNYFTFFCEKARIDISFLSN